MHTQQQKSEALLRLLDIMVKLREKCQWNAAQTFDSLRPMTLEEVYELSDAVLHHDNENVMKELGDVLLHVVFYSRVAEENGLFDFADVAETVSDKMVRRHPHVFESNEELSAEEVSRIWEMIKTKEKGGNKRVLSGVPDSMPSVLKAFFMQDKARGVGFDWEEKSQVWDKVKEEMGEYQAELDAADAASSPEEKAAAMDRAEAELGDFMFATINAARLYGLDPDRALNRTCEKFRRRFTYLEEQTIRKGRALTDMTLAEMDEIWDEAKSLGM